MEYRWRSDVSKPSPDQPTEPLLQSLNSHFGLNHVWSLSWHVYCAIFLIPMLLFCCIIQGPRIFCDAVLHEGPKENTWKLRICHFWNCISYICELIKVRTRPVFCYVHLWVPCCLTSVQMVHGYGWATWRTIKTLHYRLVMSTVCLRFDCFCIGRYRITKWFVIC